MHNISNLHKGHRERLKKEFLEKGLDHFSDHRILEMLLFYSIPRSDTNEIGHRLIARFGSLSGVFDAPYELLQETKGIGPESALLIKFISQVIGAYMEDYSFQHNIIDSTEAAKEFMAYKFICETSEIVVMACLAANGKVIFFDEVAKGSPETVGIRPVDIIRMALRADATRVVLAHNHPHGIATPSNADLRTTTILASELRRVEVELYDHIIVAHESVYSMRENGMIVK